MSVYLLALLIGIIAGLRSLTPIAAVSWAARFGWLHLEGTWLGFLGATVTPFILTALALGELFADKLPKTPSRKTAVPFAGRIATGALSGAALTMGSGALVAGLLLGAIGAAIGTFGGYEFRTRLARAVGKDLPVALIEDAVAVAGAAIIVSRFA